MASQNGDWAHHHHHHHQTPLNSTSCIFNWLELLTSWSSSKKPIHFQKWFPKCTQELSFLGGSVFLSSSTRLIDHGGSDYNIKRLWLYGPNSYLPLGKSHRRQHRTVQTWTHTRSQTYMISWHILILGLERIRCTLKLNTLVLKIVALSKMTVLPSTPNFPGVAWV